MKQVDIHKIIRKLDDAKVLFYDIFIDELDQEYDKILTLTTSTLNVMHKVMNNIDIDR